ncbi:MULTISPECIES: cytochrome P450/oxidoreductase [Mameliella]|uniref:cytochrome P450/oxidoreductase n=1 Tax=Mameliella TaxID=1434019 RepID=UPI000B534599|nr:MULTISPECIES: cytochrome P450/oxidoreductase [Mameliella]MBV6635461.1 cytochrome P450/oxidoreductase [Mameliella sp.]MCR9275391.1 cytochrome P450/oxidoreductase [Paracoccaceae bacterium]OWV52091.1 cytochrome [Mameliella alba]
MPNTCPVETPALSPNGCPISGRAAAFTPFNGPYQVDPGEALKWAREEEPVFFSPEIGYWVVTRYEDVKSVFRDNILFSPSIALEKITPAGPEAQAILQKYGFAMQRTMVNEDEPHHMERRRLLLDDFLPENLQKHESAMRTLTRRYMDRFIDRGHADLVEDIFSEIPLTIALHFLGVPEKGAEQLRGFAVAHTLNTWGRPTPEEQLEISENVGRFWQTANRVLDDMIANPDGEGWMYETVRQHFKHPDAVPESYLRSMMMAILAAAHETTSNATANAFWTLLNNRESWEELCETPSLIPSAVEECLRVAGSIVAWRRIATDDTTVGGVDIPKGGKLLIVQASANKDNRHWENADDFDIYRDNASEHMTFGYGAHQCMGKNIGRMEMRIFLEEFTRRLPHMRLVKGQVFENLPNVSFRGPSKLLVEWDPALNPEKTDPSVLDRSLSFKIGAPVREGILRRVVVRDVIDDSTGVKRFVLADPKGRKLPKFSAGAHIDLVVGDYRRKYSLCGDASDTKTFEIAILRENNGRGGSKFFHDNVAPGDVVHIAGPRNHFRLDANAPQYILIAGGIGITPILAMADRLKASGKPYHIHFCGKSRDRLPLLDRVQDRHGQSLSLHITAEGTRLDLDRALSKVGGNDRVYACGPDRLLDELESLSANWPEGTLKYELFSSANGALDSSVEHAFEVELRDSGMTVSVAADQTLYDALRASGVDMPMDCGEGLCGTCETRVIDGEIDHRDRVLSAKERAQGDRLMTCCSRARNGKLVLAL